MPLSHTVKEVTTADGVHGLLIHVPDAPILHYEIFFHGGYHAVADGSPQQTAHVLEHMVFSATADKRYPSKDDYLNAVLKNGAITNASTFYAGLWYYADCDIAEWRRMVDLHRLALEDPLLTEETLKAEIGNASGEMKRNIHQYSRLATERAYEELGLGALTSEEHVASFKDVTLERIREQYSRTHTLANMQFIVVGDLSDKEDDVIHAFSGWKLAKGQFSESCVLTLKTGGSYVYKRVNDLPSIYLNITMAVPRYLSQLEDQAFQVINSYLFNALNSKVLGEARHQGLAYELHGYLYRNVEKHSTWDIWAPIPRENTAAVLDLILDALHTIVRDGFSSERFGYVKTFSTGRAKQYGQTVATLGDLYSDPFSVDHSVPSFENVDALFEDVTADVARRLVREFVGSKSWVLSGVGAVDEAVFKQFYQKCADFFKEIQ